MNGPETEAIATAHRSLYVRADSYPSEWAEHVAECRSCDRYEQDATRAHAFIRAYLLAHPGTEPVEVGDVLAFFEADITPGHHYPPDGRFWQAIADEFTRAIEAVTR